MGTARSERGGGRVRYGAYPRGLLGGRRSGDTSPNGPVNVRDTNAPSRIDYPRGRTKRRNAIPSPRILSVEWAQRRRSLSYVARPGRILRGDRADAHRLRTPLLPTQGAVRRRRASLVFTPLRYGDFLL